MLYFQSYDGSILVGGTFIYLFSGFGETIQMLLDGLSVVSLNRCFGWFGLYFYLDALMFWVHL